MLDTESRSNQGSGKLISELTNAVLGVLAEHNEPCTFSYLSFSLPEYDFDQIEEIVDLLKMQALVSEGANGLELTRSAPVAVPSPTAPADKAAKQGHPGSFVDVSEPAYVNADVILELDWHSGVFRDDPVSRLGLPARIEASLASCGIRLVADLVANLGSSRIRGLGEKGTQTIRQVLSQWAKHLSSSQKPFSESLAKLSGSSEFCFDAFGVLCKIPKDAASCAADVFDCKVIRQAYSGLARRGYPLYLEGFLCVFGHLGKDPQAESKQIVSEVEQRGALLRACRYTLFRSLAKQAQAVLGGNPAEPISVLKWSPWTEAAHGLAWSRRWCSFDARALLIEFCYPRFTAWLDSLNPVAKKVVKTRLLGKPFAKCCFDDISTPAAAQALFAETMRGRPYFFEDSYRHLVQTYLITAEQFASATGEGVQTFNYLRRYACKDPRQDVSLAFAIADPLVPQSARAAICGLSELGSVSVRGVDVHLDISSILSHIAKEHASKECISWKRALELYRAFLRDNQVPEGIAILQVEDSRALKKAAESCPDVLVANIPGSDNALRYYDSAHKRFAHLATVFSQSSLRNCECSTLALFRLPENAQILEQFDIRNEYELHAAAKKFCLASHSWHLGKAPMVTLGKADRERQVLGLIKELSPVAAADLADEYERRYGVKQSTFKAAGYLKPFKAYEKNGKYVFSDAKLTRPQLSFLREVLTGEMHSLSLVRARFFDKFPSASTAAINDRAIACLGYRISEGLIVKKDVKERSMFESLLDAHPTFNEDDGAFGKEVFDHPAFASCLSKRVRNFELLEWKQGSYITSKRLFSTMDGRYRMRDIRSYIEKAFSFFPAGTPFTVSSLRQAGFVHKLDRLRNELGLGDFFFESILVEGKANRPMKSTRFGGVTVFCQVPGSFAAADLIEAVVSREKVIEVDDLIDLLADDFGIEASAQSVRLANADVYFVDSMDTVFDSVETFREFARGLL